jgi:hypothetical protein
MLRNASNRFSLIALFETLFKRNFLSNTFCQIFLSVAETSSVLQPFH